jgi:hypothetical protein
MRFDKRFRLDNDEGFPPMEELESKTITVRTPNVTSRFDTAS